MDSTTKGSETRLSASTLTICLSSGCARHVYTSNMFARHTHRLPQTKLPRGNPFATIRRIYHVFYESFSKEARNLSILLDQFVDFSGLQINQAKSPFVGFDLTQEGSM